MSTYFAILTAIGEAKRANAELRGEVVQITHMAVGDGNGITPVPNREQKTLVNEVRRASINTLDKNPSDASQIVVEQVIPENVGGWWIREIGLYDAEGDLVAVGNAPASYKPMLDEGSGRTQVIRMVLIWGSSSTIQLKIDPAIVMATRKYVDDKTAASAAALHAHETTGNPHPQYATDEDLTAHAGATDPHPQYWNDLRGNAKIAAAIAKILDSTPAHLDTLAELAAALGNDANFAATVTHLFAQKAPLDSPALTGEPTAPTPAADDDSDRLATTAFVQAALARALPVFSVTALPTADRGPIIVAEMGEVWLWSASAHYTGYRSLLCGRVHFGHTLAPLPFEVDAVGGILSKDAYRPLFAYAAENGLVVPAASWIPGTHHFVDLDNGTFRVPDLRDQFLRMSGTDADTATAVALGAYKRWTTGRHRHRFYGYASNIHDNTGGLALVTADSGGYLMGFLDGGAIEDTGKAETAPNHTAYAPRIHV